MTEERCYKVYCHTNLTNGKKYVGQTEQKIKRRWRNNGVGYKGQVFYLAIQKYTWDGFSHEILHDNLTASEANELEKYYIKEWDLMNPKKGYNRKEGGDNQKPSEEARRKMSESHKGFKVSEETKEKLRQINKNRCGDKNPMFGKGKEVICIETKEIFNSCRIAGDELNIEPSSISAVCRGKRKSAGDLHFCYSKDYDENKEYDLSLKKRKVRCLNTGEIFNSITEAKNKLNIKNAHISEVCSRKLKSINGYSFEYYIDNIDEK